MTLSELLTACTNNEALFNIVDSASTPNHIATLTPDSVSSLSATVSAYTVTSFNIENKTSVKVVVSTN